MTNGPDPYRVLGLATGASLDDVKRAYRRLAKQYHPDSAGAAATARFLAVHAAYESIVSARPPATGGRRAASRPAPGARPGAAGRSERGSAGTGGPYARASEADPERARATRDAYARYRAGRTGERSSGTWRPGAGRATGSAGAASGAQGAGAGAPTDDRRPPDGEAPRAEGPERPARRGVRKARLGSTSYDDAEARDPQWGGATWYGQASGTYWTINPKEYADPRKHGPDYQARARRGPASDTEGEVEAAASTTSTAGTEARAAEASWTWSGPGATTSGPTKTPALDERWRSMPPVAGAPAMDAAEASPPSERVGTTPSSAEVAEHVGALPRLPLPRRVVAALVAWPVIGLAAAGLAGDLTGCARFSASCGQGADLVPALLQPAILLLLLLLPRFAEMAAVGTLAVVLAAVPAVVLLSATGGSRAPAGEAPAALVVILALAWGVGVVAAAAGGARLRWPATGR